MARRKCRPPPPTFATDRRRGANPERRPRRPARRPRSDGARPDGCRPAPCRVAADAPVTIEPIVVARPPRRHPLRPRLLAGPTPFGLTRLRSVVGDLVVVPHDVHRDL